MRKIIIYIALVIGICFIIPIFLTVKFKVKEVATENKIILDIEKYAYSDFGTIRLLHKNTSEIEEVPLDEYVTAVVSAEIPVDYDIEAIKAQSVATRTYTIYKIIHGSKHENADICDDASCCQAWISRENRIEKWGENGIDNMNKIIQAVNATVGEVITYEGQIINAFFHSNSGGKTETVSNVWGGTDLPYLQAVETAGEEEYSQYSSEVTFTKEELLNKLKESYKDIQIDFGNNESIKILELTDGNRVKTIRLGNKELSGVEARRIFGLKSANFNVTIKDEKITFKVTGNGHGVGMSQTGADALANQGKTYKEILSHFYTGIDITKFN